MNHLKQVAWIAAAEKRIQDLERQLSDAMKRIETLEAKRGPGRPRNDDRNSLGNDRKV